MALTFGRAVVNVRNSFINDGGIIMEVVVEFAFVYQLRVFSVHRFNLHGNFKICLSVDGLVDFSEGSFINLPDDFEVLADFL